MKTNVFHRAGHWWYLDELDQPHGPYGRREDAEDALQDYCEALYGPKYNRGCLVACVCSALTFFAILYAVLA